MMVSQILKFVDFTKTQKYMYLESKTFFHQIKKMLITDEGLLCGKKCFCSTSGGNLLSFEFKFGWSGHENCACDRHFDNCCVRINESKGK